MARIFQLNPVTGNLIAPDHLLAVDRSTDGTRRASQLQVVRGLLQQQHDPAIGYPAGSFGQLFLANAATGIGSIDALTVTPGPVVETGASVSNPVLAWTLSPMSVTSQTLTGPLTAGVTLNPADRSKALVGAVTTDSTWQLAVVNSGGNLSRQVQLSFGHKVHYGKAGATLANSAAVLALSGEKLATSAPGDYSYPAGTAPNLYSWFCYPDSWGTVLLRDAVNGTPVAVQDTGILSVTNASGHTRNFRCLRSLNGLNAAMTVRVS